MPLFLTEAQVFELVTMTDAVAVVEACFRRQGEGKATHEPRRRVRTPRGALHVMFAADPQAGVAGVKSYVTSPAGARFHLLLYDTEAGQLLCIMEADRLGQLRTGAATGVATRLLARPDAGIGAVFGAGHQAETQVEALALARSFQEIRVYSRDAERRARFCCKLEDRLHVPVRPAANPEEALAGAHVVTTVTSSTRPVFDGAQVEAGMHLNVAGSNSLLKREVDDAAVARADLIAVDSLAAVPLESGDLLAPLQKGLIYPESLVELGQIAAGLHPGRQSDAEVTLFKSHGIALEDVALAALVYRRAREQRVGLALPG